MTYKLEIYESYLEKIKDFKKLGWVENHLNLMKKPNFWTILEYGEDKGPKDRSAHETRSSRMLRWLLDANETHNLGNIFAHKLIQRIGEDYKYSQDKNQAIKSTAEEMDIDVFYKDLSQKMCLVIEFKQFAKESKSTGFDSQLDKYEALITEWIEERDEKIHPYYIYLTPLKEEPSNENWHPLSYLELIDIINQVFSEYLIGSEDMYKEETIKIISDYKDDLQRSIDYLKKDNNYINKNLTEEEKELTLTLAEEIEHGIDSKHLDKLMEIDKGDDSELKNLILIMKDYISAQNHSPNTGVRILMRKIYNYLSDGKKLDTVNLIEYKEKQTITALKSDLIEKYGLDLVEIELTSRKGQGLSIYHKNNKHRIYLSGDTYGDFPNDGIQLLDLKKKDKKYVSKTIGKGEFRVDDALILEDKLINKAGDEIHFEQLMEDYIMRVIKELNDKVAGK